MAILLTAVTIEKAPNFPYCIGEYLDLENVNYLPKIFIASDRIWPYLYFQEKSTLIIEEL